MCGTLVEVREGMAGIAARFDPAVLSVEACARVVDEASAIEKMAATVKSLAAARVAETELWRKGGDRSAAHELARRTGTSVRAASDAIETGKRLGSLPAVDEAARRGELSAEQAVAIADAASTTASREVEERLVRHAERSSLGELRDACLQAKAASRTAEETHQRIKAERRLRTFTDGEGAWNLTMRDTPEAGAEIMAVLEPIRDRLFREAHAAGRREPAEAYGADAMVELARRAAGSGGERSDPVRPGKAIVRIDWDALVRGWPIDGETCEIAGVGPVPVSVVEAMIDSGDVFLAAVVTKGVDVVNVAHLGRQPTAFQQTGMEWRDPKCVADGCNNVARLQRDHRHDWADTKITLLGWLDRLCAHHHALKTRLGWALVEGSGKRPMVPPDDPRHPQYRPAATATGPPNAA